MKAFIGCLVIIMAATCGFAQTPPPAAKTSTTVPITFDHNRIVIDVRLPLPDGTTKRVRAWVDNGNAQIWMTGDLAKKLNLLGKQGVLHETPFGKEASGGVPPVLLIGGMEIRTTGLEISAVLDRDSVAPGSSAEITIPPTVLRHYDIIVDYPNREFTIGLPGTLSFKGAAMKAQLSSDSAVVQLPASLAGDRTNLQLNLGASIGLLTPVTTAKLLKTNPKWPHMMGGVDVANVWGFPEEATWQVLRVPDLQMGKEVLNNVGFATFPDAAAEWFAKRAGADTGGFIGGNAFLDYRVGIDYAHATVYLERTSKMESPEMDVVGLTLRPEPDDTYTIVGVPEYNGKPAVPDVKPGDVLVSIDKTPAKGGTMGQVWSLLAGSPGDTRVLVVQRDGKEITVNASVQRFLGTSSK